MREGKAMAKLYPLDDYNDAARYLGTRTERKLGHNTYLVRRGEDIAVKYHATDVVTYHADGTATVNTGGWYTVTTKERINTYLPAWQVQSVKGTWQIADVPFVDGIRVGRDGEITFPDGVTLDTVRELIRADAATKKAIGSYVRGWTAQRAEQCAADAGGDCWYCAMRGDDGIPWGDTTGDVAHLRDHVAERYYMASLALNAIREAGYGSPEVIYWHAPDQARRALRRYLESRLLVGPSGGRRQTAAVSNGWG